MPGAMQGVRSVALVDGPDPRPWQASGPLHPDDELTCRRAGKGRVTLQQGHTGSILSSWTGFDHWDKTSAAAFGRQGLPTVIPDLITPVPQA